MPLYLTCVDVRRLRDKIMSGSPSVGIAEFIISTTIINVLINFVFFFAKFSL